MYYNLSMILRINTEDAEVIEVSLKKEGQETLKMTDKNRFGSQALLPLIRRLLKEAKVEFKDLKGIEVAKGPGSFTGIKVGASVANALGFSLGIPVNSKRMETEFNY